MSKIFYMPTEESKGGDKGVESGEPTAEAERDSSQIGIFPDEAEKNPAPAADAVAESAPKKKLSLKIGKKGKKESKKAPKVERLYPDLDRGLTSQQAEDRSLVASNKVEHKNSRSYLSIFVGNICTYFNLVCLLAGIALILANMQGITNYMVLFIAALNIIIGIIQEIRSKRTVDKLSLLAPSYVHVIRDGEIKEIDASEIVLDDVITLEAGNQVPADVILAEGSVDVNESLLTGESESVKKNVGDELYAGSFLSGGHGTFRVDKVGHDTYIQHLTAKAKKYKKPNSELINSTKLIIKIISILMIPIAIGTYLIAYHNADPTVTGWVFNDQISYALQRTCSVVIGMIPSGMLLLTSVALAVGIIRLARTHTLVQDMYSLEMLARVDVLCFDKTGTITDGQMQVKDVILLNPPENYTIEEIMGSMVKSLNDNNHTSIALHNRFGYSDALTPLNTIPFNSKIKLSAVTFDEEGTYVMGAPEFVLKPYPSKVAKMVKQYAQDGYRVLCVAHSPNPIVGDRLPSVLKPVALITIADNVRDDAVETIQWFKDNEVEVKVISGDNPVTVAEVAKRAGIENADKLISLEGLSDREVEAAATQYTVFGRVTPEQKAVLIRALKAQDNTVAMTGDGVNDILAMKEADVAISVASGSDAARNVSHLVLMDNNFSSMPKVVEEGRRVINNIQTTSCIYIMKTLFTTLMAIICIAMQEPYIFSPQNLLLMEVAIIAIPTFFLSLQPNKNKIKGRFLPHVLADATAGAVLLVLLVMSMYITQFFNEDFADFYKPLCMMALTFGGFVMIYRVCRPFNAYRAILVLFTLALCIAAFSIPYVANSWLYPGWSDLPWSYAQVLVVVVVIEAAFPISSWLLRLMHYIVPSSVRDTRKEKRKKKEKEKDKEKDGEALSQEDDLLP